MKLTGRWLSRRGVLKILGAASGGIAVSRWLGSNVTVAQSGDRPQGAQDPAEKAIETFTDPGPNAHWNSVGPYVTEPQKVPLILLTDRPVQLASHRHYFLTAFVAYGAFK